MNDNPEGTPNPLNPGVGAGLGFTETEPSVPETPAEPEVPAEPEAPGEPETPAVSETPAGPETDIAEDFAFKVETPQNNFDTLGMEDKADEMVSSETVSVNISPAPAEPVAAEPVAAEPVAAEPMPELVAKDSIVEPAGKGNKKKILIIGAIILAIIAVICGATAVAIMMLQNNNGDRVNKAIEKLLNGEMPSIISAQGRISALSNADNTDINSFDIDFNGSFDVRNTTNTISAKVNADMKSGDKVSIGVDELENKDGEVFFKIRGFDTLSNNQLVSAFSGLTEVIDDTWILVTGDFSENMEGLQIFDNSSACLVNAFSTLPKYGKDIAKKYEANQFITYSTDKLETSKKKNPLYRVSFDSNKLSAFVNSLSNNGFINELNACTNNTATNSATTATSIENIFKIFPSVYLEIDDNYNITRVYFKTNLGDEAGSMNVTADLALSYPNKLEVVAPDEYVDMSILVDKLVTGVLTSGDTGLTEIEVGY